MKECTDNTVLPPHLHPVPHLCSILLLPEGKFQNIDLIALLSLTPFRCPTPTAHGVKSEIWSMLFEIPSSLLRLGFLLLSPGSQLAKAETSRLFPGLPLGFQNTADYLHVPWPLPRTPFFAALRPQHESLLSRGWSFLFLVCTAMVGFRLRICLVHLSACR